MGNTNSISSSSKASLLDLNFVKYNSTAALANFVQPIFTTFLSLLAVELHANIFEIGLVGGGASVVYAFMPFVMGRFSDRGQARKFFIILSLGLLAAVSILYSFSASPIDLIALRLVEGLGWAAFWPSIDAAVTHDTKVDPKRALAIFNLSWSSAASLGPVIGSVVIVIFSIRQVFIFNAIFLLVAMSINLIPYSRIRRSGKLSQSSDGEITLHQTVIENVEETATFAGKEKNESSERDRKKVRVSFYVLSLVMCTIISNTIISFFSPYANSQGLPIIIIGAISATYSAARFFGYLLTSNGRINSFLLDSTIRSRNILLFLFLTSLSSLLMVFHSPSGAIYFLSFALVGLSYSFVYYTAMVGLLAETRKERMGAGAGIFETSIGAGSLVGPIIAGSVAGNSLTVPFVVPFFCTIPILGLLLYQSRNNSTVVPGRRVHL